MHGFRHDSNTEVAGLGNAREDAVARLELLERVGIPTSAARGDEAVLDQIVLVTTIALASRVVEILPIPFLLDGAACPAPSPSDRARLGLCRIDEPTPRQVLRRSILEVLKEHYAERDVIVGGIGDDPLRARIQLGRHDDELV